MRRIIRIMCMVLSVLFLVSIPVLAEESNPYSSIFFASYDSFIRNPAGNSLRIWFDVVGNGIMDEIGVQSVLLERSSDGENWTSYRTFFPEDYPQMICEDTGIAYDYVSCAVSYGYYYRAYVTFYAKNSRGRGNAYDYAETIYLPVP